MNLTRHLYERQVFDMSNSYTHLTLQDRIIPQPASISARQTLSSDRDSTVFEFY